MFGYFFRDEKIVRKFQHLDTFEALFNLYKELKHSLYKTYKGNASIPYINSKVPQKCQDFWFFDNFFISKMQHLVTFEALLNLYKEFKHSLYKTYKGNDSIPYINSKVHQKCQDVGFFENFVISKKSSENFSDHLGRS